MTRPYQPDQYHADRVENMLGIYLRNEIPYRQAGKPAIGAILCEEILQQRAVIEQLLKEREGKFLSIFSYG